ncbi:MAG: hypothetical protein WDZ50_00195 [Woeseia sp.]
MRRILVVLLPFCMPCAAASVADVATDEDSVLARYPLTEESLQQWDLPSTLAEISGLAVSDDGRLLAVDDEQAIVYELNYDDGRLVKAFAFGERRTLRGDFEGIAWLENQVYLVTSDGTIYIAREGADGERVSFSSHRTGVGRDCEIEGLATDPARQLLLLLCKRAVPGSDLSNPLIFHWSIADRTIEWPRRTELPLAAIETALGSSGFRPSGIARAMSGERWLIVAARERAVIEIDRQGRLIAARTLPLAERHRQAEGIELLADGRLLIADESRGRPARLSVYRPLPDAIMISP